MVYSLYVIYIYICNYISICVYLNIKKNTFKHVNEMTKLVNIGITFGI